MKIIIPYTKIEDATLISLRGYDFEEIKVSGKYGYSKFFKQQWDKRQDFINIEHDSVLWPGAIEAIEGCPEPWCGYDYSSATDWRAPNINSVPIGCMKITSKFMEQLPNLWDKPIDWHYCDGHMFRTARDAGIQIHQHFPGIVNANKELAKLVRNRNR